MKRKPDHGFPGRDAIVAFIRANPGKVGTREIAREFGLKNADRVELKRILRELADDGTIAKRGRKIHEPAALPPTVLADITGRDSDGELIAAPAEWDSDENGTAPKIRIETPRRPKPGTTAGVGDRALLRVEVTDEQDGTPYRGRVIKVIDHGRTRILGIFRRNPDGGGRLIPVDKKQAGRELNIAKADSGGAEDGDLISVDLIRTRGYGLASARVKERLGSIASEKAISLIAINTHDIPQVFSSSALREAEEAKPATLQGREDWRDVPLVTIDPPDAKDHDDAVHAEVDPDPNNKGGFIVHVAIADVAYYVRPGSALDRDALQRGNSVYFPDRVVPMLPERISNDLCSLVPGEPRGALAVRMVIGADGRKRSHTFHRVLMRSAAKLNYAQAQAAIDGGPDDTTGPILDPVLKPLWSAYELVKLARNERDPLDLDLPERKILLKADGTVDRVIVPQRLDAHRLIEEFMILANVAAAEMLEKKALPLIYRVHDEPSQEKVHNLQEFLKTLDLPFTKQGALRPTQFNRVLAQVAGEDYEPLVNEVVLRSQAQAEYSAENYGHFGLNLRRYAHFTSPIRRYADLIVHRALIRALGLGEGALPTDETVETLAEIAAQISVTERRAMKAERETTDRLIAHFLADKVGASFQGRISGVTRSGLFVKLDDTGADGLIPIRTIGSEYFNYDETRHTLIGTRSGTMYRLGDVVDVRLVEAAPIAGALRFELLSDGQAIPRGRKRDSVRAERRAAGFGKGPKGSGKKAHKERKSRSKKDRKPAQQKSGKSKRGKSWK
ncbi:ribonuclease R [Bradyrhizobium elkanii]|uniref:Ribonuclease R n=1 Tax=Bradyrhizobium elkanii TaxID=29448 RepID=A0ABV4F2Z0_BRAEL|nr:ribonuclease R [Bradyrhizobium elkanii]MBP2426177.1 ribonuclease R [Bradyrhizobium elkanii]MCP1749347.1 ribonuclease R [Bradyrhizobium elkanii]MCP1983919.1 ribonuclease R [Bradyrhizobium elkanii]MCS3890358.1 ribonuclease R [Bradyrhizobium elkanii]MCS4220043.1 ribonuclease R [Bradyrhizobium elkanii]